MEVSEDSEATKLLSNVFRTKSFVAFLQALVHADAAPDKVLHHKHPVLPFLKEDKEVSRGQGH